MLQRETLSFLYFAEHCMHFPIPNEAIMTLRVHRDSTMDNMTTAANDTLAAIFETVDAVAFIKDTGISNMAICQFVFYWFINNQQHPPNCNFLAVLFSLGLQFAKAKCTET